MSQITSPAIYSTSRPQGVIDIVNKSSAIDTSIDVIFIALGGILIDAYQAAMVGLGNKYIAAQFDISPGLAVTVNASVLIAALIGGLSANRVINRLGQKRTFIIGMGLCTIGATAVAIAPSILWVLVCRVIMGFGLGIDFPLATSAVAEPRGSTLKKAGTSVNPWQMAWYVSIIAVYLVLLPSLLSGTVEEQSWHYGIFVGVIFAVIFVILCYSFIGGSAIWAARVGRYQEVCDILGKRYGVQAHVAASGTMEAKFSEKAENKYSGGYDILLNDCYRKRTTPGCVVATTQTWQYDAVGAYLSLTLARIISDGPTGALAGSAVVNALCGVTGGMIGSFIPQRLGTRRQSMYGFAVVTLALLSLGALAMTNPWLSLGLSGSTIFFHSTGPGGLGMTIATLSYPPAIRPTGVGFARVIMRTGAIAGLTFWPMLQGTSKTEAFYWLAIVPFLGFLIYVLVNQEPLSANVGAEGAEVLAELKE